MHIPPKVMPIPSRKEHLPLKVMHIPLREEHLPLREARLLSKVKHHPRRKMLRPFKATRYFIPNLIKKFVVQFFDDFFYSVFFNYERDIDARRAV